MQVPWSARGVSGAGFNQGAETIIDLCGPNNPALATSAVAVQLRPQLPDQPGPVVPVIDPSASWLYYANRLELVMKGNVVRHRPLGARGGNTDPGPDATGGSTTDLGSAQGNLASTIQNVIPDTFQRPGSAAYKVRMIGRAMRVGFRIPVPQLVSVGGVPVELAYDVSSEEVLGSAGGIPIFGSRWRREYLLATAPAGQIDSLSNPVTKTDSTAQNAVLRPQLNLP
jgi:hypothetical protein